MFAAFLCTILFSISILCGHRSAKMLGGTEANFWRLVFAALSLGAWSFAGGSGLGGASLPMFVMSGIIGIGIGDIALFQALPRLGSRLCILVTQCTGAPFAALIEWLWLKTPLTFIQILCSATVLTGVGIALSPGKGNEHDKSVPRGRILIVGGIWGVLAGLGNAVGAVFSRRAYGIAHENQDVVSGHEAAFQRVLGGLAIAAICLVIVKRGRFKAGLRELEDVIASAIGGVKEPREGDGQSDFQKLRHKWVKAGPWVFMNSLAGQTLGMSFMQKAFETTPTGLVLSIIATTPIIVIPLAYLFEGERPTRRSVIGGLVAVAGVALLVWTKPK